MKTNGVSIIICCYNSSERIEKTLQHIAVQEFDNINSEVIIVDNASNDNTVDVAKLTWQKANNTDISFKTIYESTPGLAYARKKGIDAASFDFLIFCDDDNWLDKNYLQNTYKLFKSYPDVAILGGVGTAEFEDPKMKPFWFDKFYHGFAVGPQAEKECIIGGVYGAGMAIRKSVLKEVMKMSMFLHGRKQSQLTSGEDAEICFRIRLAGYQILYSPELTFKHFLTTSRLSWRYFKNLHIGLAKTNVVLSLYEKALISESLELSFFYWIKKALYYWGIYLKYWPKHYLAYRKGEGTIEEIHHITWKNIALCYWEFNFKTISIYQKILTLSKFNYQAELK